MKIYTKRGDQGQTDLYGGARVPKSHPRVIAYGLVDAANSHIGSVYVLSKESPAIHEHLQTIMSDLFNIGAELASVPERANQTAVLTNSRTTNLEELIDQADNKLPELKSFILPTGCELASRLHLARVAVRQAEQHVSCLPDVRSEVLQYLNRLSDLLFTWARLANLESSAQEILWVSN